MSPDTAPDKTPESTPRQTPPQKREPTQGTNPVAAIAIAIVISMILAGIGLVSFLRSDTKKNIALIQQSSNQQATDGSVVIDETSPLTESDLSQIHSAIEKDIDALRNDVDFNANELTDAALGL